MSPGVGDQPGQHGETPSLPKKQKLPRCNRPVVLATWEAEVGGSSEPGEVEAAVSHAATALQLEQESETMSQKKKRKEKKV